MRFNYSLYCLARCANAKCRKARCFTSLLSSDFHGFFLFFFPALNFSRTVPITALEGLKVFVLFSPLTTAAGARSDWPGVSSHVPLFFFEVRGSCPVAGVSIQQPLILQQQLSGPHL